MKLFNQANFNPSVEKKDLKHCASSSGGGGGTGTTHHLDKDEVEVSVERRTSTP